MDFAGFLVWLSKDESSGRLWGFWGKQLVSGLCLNGLDEMLGRNDLGDEDNVFC